MSRLVSHVHVLTEDGSGHVIFGPEDEVPDWAARRIGSHAWEDGEHPLGGADDEVDADGVDDRQSGSVPPRGGKGSGQPEWLSFARENGIEVDDDEDRAVIIAKCEDAGLVEAAE